MSAKKIKSFRLSEDVIRIINEMRQCNLWRALESEADVIERLVREKRHLKSSVSQSSEELLPCPFCGGNPEIKQFSNPKTMFRIVCTICRCNTDGYMFCSDDAQENIAANISVWNKRV